LILAELLEYSEWSSINIKTEIPSWIKRENQRLVTQSQVPYDDNIELKRRRSKKHNKHHNEKAKSQSFNNSFQDKAIIEHKKKKESQNKRRKRERKEKKLIAKANSPYVSKNEKRKLRTINEEEEDSQNAKNIPTKNDEYFQCDNEMELQPSYGSSENDTPDYRPILKKRMTSPNKKLHPDLPSPRKSKSFGVEDGVEASVSMKKHLSFNLDPQTKPQPSFHRKKSSLKSKKKDYNDKQKHKRDSNFVPLRESQIDVSWLNPPSQKIAKNKDDFEVNSPSLPEINFSEPMMRKRGASHKTSSNLGSIANLDDDDDMDLDLDLDLDLE
jgi:hypothetical protein